MNNFETNVITIWGEQGKKWLQQLPHYVAVLAAQWQLSNLTPVPNLSYNYVLKGFKGNVPIVVKLCFEKKAFTQECAALQAYAGRGCIQLLDTDIAHNAMLLEQAIPGTSLKSLFPQEDDQALEYTVEVMQQLHAAHAYNAAHFPTINDWLKGLNKAHQALSKKHIQAAQKWADQLLATQRNVVLLHGDLHHDNIILGDQGWVAIDPKGVIGEPAYEIGAFVRNPFPELLQQPNAAEIMHHRIKLFAALLKIDEQRLYAWSYVQAVLAACWAMEDGQIDPHQALAEAELLAAHVLE